MENNFFVQFGFVQVKRDTRIDPRPVGKRLRDLCEFIISTISKTSFAKWHVANSLDETKFDPILEEEEILKLLRGRLKDGRFIEFLIKLNADTSKTGGKIIVYYGSKETNFLITEETKERVIDSLRLQNDQDLIYKE